MNDKAQACRSFGNTTRGVLRLSDLLNIAGKRKIKAYANLGAKYQ